MALLRSLASILVLVVVCNAQGDLVRVGNDIIAGSATTQARTTFLLDEEFGRNGVVFAFSGYFVNTNPLYFQVWRPVDADSRQFKLIAEWQYTPLGDERREDLYLATRETDPQMQACLRVESTDRLGVYIAQAPGSLAYDFFGENPTTYQYSIKNGTAPSPSQDVTFDALPWPYKFSVAAYIDADLSRYPSGSFACPRDMFVPKENGYGQGSGSGSNGATGATGATGSSGSTGPRGQRGPEGEFGATGATGPSGAVGGLGPAGTQGSTGPGGPSGATGVAGPTGGRGPKGEKGDSVPGSGASATTFEELVSGCDWCSKFLNPYLILGIIIWLVLVTLLLVIVMTIVTCRNKKNDKNYEKNLRMANGDPYKKYENGGYDANGDNTYTAIEEGRTAF